MGAAFIETMNICDYRIELLQYHKKRVLNTCGFWRMKTPDINFQQLIDNNPFCSRRVKCRIVYDNSNFSVDYFPYKNKEINTLRLVFDNDICYSYKSIDRSRIEFLLEQKDKCDDVIIVKNGLLTDCSYANLVFQKEGSLFTPAKPLLNGVQRQFLIKTHRIEEADITVYDYMRYERVLLINAMMDLDTCVNLHISAIQDFL